MNLRIMYTNAHGLTLPKFTTLTTLIQDNQFDIIVVAETWWMNTNRVLQHPYFVSCSEETAHRTTGHQNGGMLLLAQKNLHAAINVLPRTHYSISFSIFNVRYQMIYLPPSLSEDRVEEILSPIQRMNAIIGDFNVRFGTLSGDNPRLRNHPKNRANTVWDAINRHGLHYRKPAGPCSRTDHIFTDFKPHKVQYQRDIIPSDHGALSFEAPIEVPTSTANASLRLSLKNLADPVRYEHLKTMYDANSTNLDHALQLLQDVVGLGDHAIGDIIEQLIDAIGAELSRVIWTSAEAVLGTYRLNDKKLEYDYLPRLLDHRTSIPTAIRTYKRSMRGQNPPLISRTEGRTPLDDVIAKFRTEFASHRPPPARPDYHIAAHPDVATISDRASLAKTIAQYPSSKAGGDDNIPTSILRCLLGSNMLGHLVSFFRTLAITGRTPQCWNTSRVYLLAKEQTPTVTVDASRPIALTRILRRIFEIRCLTAWKLQPWAVVHPAQAGFRRGYSAAVQALVSDSLARRGYCKAIYLDLKAAYDRVPFDRLLTRLVEAGTPPYARSLIYSLMCRSPSSTFLVNGSETVAIPRERGLFQGSIISPLLFDLFIDPLVRKANPPDQESPTLLAYADDLKINCRDLAAAYDALQQCVQWADVNEMTFNVKKCGAVGFTEIEQEMLYIKGERIPAVKEYKYLGFPTGRAGILWSSYRDKLLQKTQDALRRAKQRTFQWPHWSRLAIYRTFVRSMGEYGMAPLLAFADQGRAKMMDPLRQTHAEAMEWILDGKLNEVVAAALTGVPYWGQYMEESHGNFYLHLQRSAPTNPARKLETKAWGSLQTEQEALPYLWRKPGSIQQLEIANRTRPADAQLRWPTFKRKLRQRMWWQTRDDNPILQNYLYVAPRNGYAIADLTLNITDPLIRRLAIQWRTNRLVYSRICAKCSTTMTRRCIEQCGLLDTRRDLQYCWDGYELEVTHMRHRGLRIGTYNIIDSVLNSSNFEVFKTLVYNLFPRMQPPNTNDILDSQDNTANE